MNADSDPFPHAEPHTPHPHPAAPSEIAEKFESFQKTLESGPHFDANKLKDFKQLAAETAFPIGTDGPQGPVQTGALDAKQAQSSGNNIASGGSGPKAHTPTTRTDAADDLHDLPERFWRTPTLILEDTEMEAIMVSFSTSYDARQKCTADATNALIAQSTDWRSQPRTIDCQSTARALNPSILSYCRNI